jgi:hypothetical protein
MRHAAGRLCAAAASNRTHPVSRSLRCSALPPPRATQYDEYYGGGGGGGGYGGQGGGYGAPAPGYGSGPQDPYAGGGGSYGAPAARGPAEDPYARQGHPVTGPNGWVAYRWVAGMV